jgi:hypothetical protein
VDLLERGDRTAVDAQIEAFTAGARQLRQPLYVWQATVWRAMTALLGGRLAEAEEQAGEALAGGAPAEEVAAAQYYAIQLLATRREQARIGELEPAARGMVASNPTRPAWRAALAVTLCESDQEDRARPEIEAISAHGFADVPYDGDWLTTMTLLCDACVAVGDLPRLAPLYEALLPYEDVNVVAGIGALCLGSAARYLGKLAAADGHLEDAEVHFARALEANSALGSPVLVAHTRLDWASALEPGTRAERMIEEAALSAEKLGLATVARRVTRLRAGSPTG